MEEPLGSQSRPRRQSGPRVNLLKGLSTLQTRHGNRPSIGSFGFVKRLEQQPPLGGHDGCVNTIAWDETGEFLLSGSDDRCLNIYRPLDAKPLLHSIPSGHHQNIFSAKFLTHSSASKIVSCSADGLTLLTDVHRFAAKSKVGDWSPSPGFNCHTSMTYEVLPDLVDGHIFYDCGDDGKINRYDTRVRTSCDCDQDGSCDLHTFINISSRSARPSRGGMSMEERLFRSFTRRRDQIGISAIAQRPEMPVYMAAACADDTVRIYDSRKASGMDSRGAQVYSFSPFVPTGWVAGENGEPERGLNHARGSFDTRITSLKYDPNGTGQLLVSYSRGDCYLIDPSELISREEEAARRDPTFAVGSSKGRAQLDIKGKRRRSSSHESDESSTKEAIDMPESTLGKSLATTRRKSAEDPKASPSQTSKDYHGRAGRVRFKPSVEVAETDQEEMPHLEALTDDEPKALKSRNPAASSGGESDDAGSDIEYDDDDILDLSLSEHTSDSDSGSTPELSASAAAANKEEAEYWVRRTYQTAKTDLVQSYTGHRNARTMIKEANFLGPASEFVMSGSDDGRIFIWDKVTGKIVNVMKGDRSVVNCLQPHPISNFLLAASGIDSTIKIFMPTAAEKADLSKIRGIRRPTRLKGEVQPRTLTKATTSADPKDELDPEQAYNDGGHQDSSDEDDDDTDDSDDAGFLSQIPHHVFVRIIRRLDQERAQQAGEEDDFALGHAHESEETEDEVLESLDEEDPQDGNPETDQ